MGLQSKQREKKKLSTQSITSTTESAYFSLKLKFSSCENVASILKAEWMHQVSHLQIHFEQCHLLMVNHGPEVDDLPSDLPSEGQ